MKKQIIDSFRKEYRFLSNFWLVNIFYGDRWIPYRSVEHAYQAQKTDNEKIRIRIRDAKTPGDAKNLCKELELIGQLPHSNWNDEFRLILMEDLIKLKFQKGNFELCQMLLATGDAELIEGNDHDDIFFGVCNGVGENHLGKILMKRRAEIANYF